MCVCGVLLHGRQKSTSGALGTIHFIFWDEVFNWPRDHQLGYVIWTTSLRGLSVSAWTLRLQSLATMPGLSHGSRDWLRPRCLLTEPSPQPSLGVRVGWPREMTWGVLSFTFLKASVQKQNWYHYTLNAGCLPSADASVLRVFLSTFKTTPGASEHPSLGDFNVTGWVNPLLSWCWFVSSFYFISLIRYLSILLYFLIQYFSNTIGFIFLFSNVLISDNVLFHDLLFFFLFS